MKKTVNHILAAGLLALLSLASCTDEFIEGNDLQGVDRDKRVEVRLPFGVGLASLPRLQPVRQVERLIMTPSFRA